MTTIEYRIVEACKAPSTKTYRTLEHATSEAEHTTSPTGGRITYTIEQREVTPWATVTTDAGGSS